MCLFFIESALKALESSERRTVVGHTFKCPSYCYNCDQKTDWHQNH